MNPQYVTVKVKLDQPSADWDLFDTQGNKVGELSLEQNEWDMKFCIRTTENYIFDIVVETNVISALNSLFGHAGFTLEGI